jgi:CheY-like chemotaxis protein
MPVTPRILVVDDFPDGRQLLTEYLQFRGFVVLTAESGTEAVEIATREVPAAILMDLRMPGMDGWEATRRLRATPATRDAMIVAVTAAALVDEVNAALDAGCDAVVAKPYDLIAFADALAIALVEGPDAFRILGATGRLATAPGGSARRGSRARGVRAARA